jgi:hypothetical protein
MADPMKRSDSPRDSKKCFDGDIIELNEEDTTPAPPSESLRRWMERKYGRKAPPPQPPADEQK